MATLIASSSGPIAQAIDRVTDSRITALQAEVAEAFDPDRCRVDLLPWLAYSRGVDVWSDAWSEAQKRATIREFLKNSRNRGSKPGLIAELGTYASQVEIVEWFEEAAAGGTARVIITGGQELYSQEAQDAISAVVARVKPHTRTVSVEIELLANIISIPAPAARGELLVPVRSNSGRLVRA